MLALMTLGSVFSTVWLLGSQIAVVAVMAVFQIQHSRRLRSKLRAAERKVCIHCLYSLANLPTPGVCPECGRDFPEDAYATAWLRAWPQALGRYSNVK